MFVPSDDAEEESRVEGARLYVSSKGVRVLGERERRCRRRVMAGMGSVMEEGGRAERRVREARWYCWGVKFGGRDSVVAGFLVGSEGKTIPGESRSLSLLSSFTSRREVVMPASAPVGQAEREEEEEPRRERRVLMTEDLPTLGYPTMPTVVLRFSCLEEA